MLAPFRKAFNYSGRASRLEFWLFFVLCALAVGALSYIDSQAWGWTLKGPNPDPISQAGQILLTVPLIAVAVRRMNEVGLHPIWALLPFVGFWLLTDVAHLGFELHKTVEGKSIFGSFLVNNAYLAMQGGWILTAILLLLPANSAPKFLRSRPNPHEVTP